LFSTGRKCAKPTEIIASQTNLRAISPCAEGGCLRAWRMVSSVLGPWSRHQPWFVDVAMVFRLARRRMCG
jgi:hypothetical protein